MASLCTDKNGNRTIQFALDSRRPKLRVGKMTKRQAEAIKLRVEHLMAARIVGAVAAPSCTVVHLHAGSSGSRA